MGGGNKEPLKMDPETAAKKMDMTELQKALKEMDKKQKRILSIIGGIRTHEEEGEIVE
jgi:hypothetical protein